MKRKACFIDWWKLYVSCMIWSIISKLFLNFSLWRLSVGSLGSSQSLTTSPPLPPLWKRDKGHKHSCVLLVQPVPNTQHRKRHRQHDVHQGLCQARMIFHLWAESLQGCCRVWSSSSHVFLMFPTWGKVDVLEAGQVDSSKTRFAVELRVG